MVNGNDLYVQLGLSYQRITWKLQPADHTKPAGCV
ncbi:hypothetical protein RHSA111115_01950 [Rheinheimera salexigens]